MAVKCVFLQKTYDGLRCVFQPPERFINRKECYSGGAGCEVLLRYQELKARAQPPAPPSGPRAVTDDKPRARGTLNDFM